jgi:hypothetical protein
MKCAGVPFSHREKVPAKRADEGLRRINISRSIPSPVACDDTLSLWERGSA